MKELATALADLQANLPTVTKGEKAVIQHKAGGSHTVKYADLARVSDALLPELGKRGLSFIARPTINEQRGDFVLFYMLLHTSGEHLTGEYPIPKGAPQDVGSAITFARRYTLCAITGLAPEGDDDDGAAAQKAATRRTRVKQDRAEDTAEADDGTQRITAKQIREMQALFSQQEIKDRDAKLRYAVEVVGRPLNSSTELTPDEADQVIARLRSWAAQSEPEGGE